MADNWRTIGPLRVAIPLFNIFLNESDEQSRRLVTELAEWSHDVSMPISDSVIALAHSLAGNSATVGHSELSQLARSLEHALMRSQAVGSGDAQEARWFNDSASQIRHLLHQFAAGFLKSPAPELMAQLADHERLAADRLHSVSMRAELGDDGADADHRARAARWTAMNGVYIEDVVVGYREESPAITVDGDEMVRYAEHSDTAGPSRRCLVWRRAPRRSAP